jgi:phage terminase large subunit
VSKLQLPRKFKPLYAGDTRYYVLTGGRGSAKSFNVALFTLLLSYEPNNGILYSRYTMVSAHLSVIPEFVEKIELMGLQNDFLITKTEIINLRSGSNIIFKGLKTGSLDNTAALKSLSGISCWVMDEAEELKDEALFDKINLSIRSNRAMNRVILILNPTTKEHFIYNRFFVQEGVVPGSNIVKGNTTYIHSTYLDNKHLPESFLQEAEKIKINNPDKYNHVMLGGWLDRAEGIIFSNWDYADYSPHGIEVLGLDFGYSVDPTALTRVSIDKKNSTVYLKEELYKTHLGTSDLQTILKEKAGKGLIYADSAEARLIADLRKSGLNIFPTQKGAGSILEGIKLIQDYKIKVDPASINLVKELNNYSWKEKGLLPIDNYNHLIDGIRYAITMSTKGVVSNYSVG